LWTCRNTGHLKPTLRNSKYLFHVNKIRGFAHYAFVRTDSNEREIEGNKMAKAAMKKKAVAKKKKPMKRVASKKRAAKRRR
jgi:hypothetical protein